MQYYLILLIFTLHLHSNNAVFDKLENPVSVLQLFLCIVGKCRGLRTARKLRDHRREQKWHDKQYKKAHLGTALKANPFGGASHAKGIVLEKV